MAYIIELSFNIYKINNVTEIKEMVKSYAEKYGCHYFYEDYEYEMNTQFIRNHCILTINFQKTNILNLIEFLKFIKNKNYLYLEAIYNENSSQIIYASQFYRTKKMNKNIGKIYKKDKEKKGNNSIDEDLILHAIPKCKRLD